MKTLFLILSMSACTGWASYTQCPSHLQKQDAYLKVFKFLKSLKTQFRVGECQVELHICNLVETGTDDDIIGDIRIEREGTIKHYSTLYLPKSRQERPWVFLFRNMLFSWSLGEGTAGSKKTEKTYLEIRTSRPGKVEVLRMDTEILDTNGVTDEAFSTLCEASDK